jgi:hypothetical protein
VCLCRRKGKVSPREAIAFDLSLATIQTSSRDVLRSCLTVPWTRRISRFRGHVGQVDGQMSLNGTQSTR